jgi:ferric-dicitrate binding protein FerR (iron transport regulator)
MAVCQQRRIEKTSFDVSEELGWKEDILIFKNADVKALARELERWYGVNVELQNTGNIEKLFTGKFHNENLESILKGMGFALNFTYEIQSDTIRIQGKK